MHDYMLKKEYTSKCLSVLQITKCLFEIFSSRICTETFCEYFIKNHLTCFNLIFQSFFEYWFVGFFFRHEANRIEQEARGRLERQKIQDEAEAEKARRELLELQALSAAVESTGQAKAEAQSRAESARIEGEAAVQQAQLKAEAASIEAVRDHLNVTFSFFNDHFVNT